MEDCVSYCLNPPAAGASRAHLSRQERGSAHLAAGLRQPLLPSAPGCEGSFVLSWRMFTAVPISCRSVSIDLQIMKWLLLLLPSAMLQVDQMRLRRAP